MNKKKLLFDLEMLQPEQVLVNVMDEIGYNYQDHFFYSINGTFCMLKTAMTFKDVNDLNAFIFLFGEIFGLTFKENDKSGLNFYLELTTDKVNDNCWFFIRVGKNYPDFIHFGIRFDKPRFTKESRIRIKPSELSHKTLHKREEIIDEKTRKIYWNHL